MGKPVCDPSYLQTTSPGTPEDLGQQVSDIYTPPVVIWEAGGGWKWGDVSL